MANVLSYLVDFDDAWPAEKRPVKVAPDIWMLGGLSGPPPTVDFDTASPIAREDVVEFSVTSPLGLALVVVTAQRSGYPEEVVYANGFRPGYVVAPNAEAAIADGLHFTVHRDTHWSPGGLTIRVYASDAAGGTATASLTLTVDATEQALVPFAPAAKLAVGDFALAFDGAELDMAIADDDVEAEFGLRTAVILSLFTDRRAEEDDDLPGAQDDRRGWWADELAEVAGDKMGSRLWLLERGTTTVDVVPQAEEYAREALQWMIDDKVAERIEVAAELVGARLGYAVTIYRPGKDPVSFKFAHVWAGEAARAASP